MIGSISQQLAREKSVKQDGDRSGGRLHQPVLSDMQNDILALQLNVGNQAVGRLLQPGADHRSLIQTKLVVNQPGDRFEQEAERVAEKILHLPDWQTLPIKADSKYTVSPYVQHSDPGRRDEAANRISEVTSGQENQLKALSRSGWPLPKSTRTFMETRFGQDFNRVRLHTGLRAAEMAQSLQARAFTIGQHVVFGANQLRPGTISGKRLLAHELAHVIQQGVGNGYNRPMAVQRKEDPQLRAEPSLTLPPFSLPGTDLTLIPGALAPSLFGSPIPLPGSLRLTNAFGAGSAPSFVLDLSPRLMMLNILDNVDLYSWTRLGTPPSGALEPASQARISLISPRITFDTRSGQLRGEAILSIGSDYPPMFKPPTEVDASIRATDVGQFSGRLGYGPLQADFNLRLHYDTDRLEQALKPVFTPEGGVRGLWSRFQTILREANLPRERVGALSETLQGLLNALVSGQLQVGLFVTRTVNLVRDSIPAGVNIESLQTALRQLASEFTHPGFTLSGGLRLGPLPLTRFSAEAPTTVPLERPLLGAPAPFPLTSSAAGVIITPPGSLFDIPAPALGFTRSTFGAARGTSFTGAVLPTISSESISAGERAVTWFPVYSYLELSHVRRISEDLDIGARVILQVSSLDVDRWLGGGETGSRDPAERLAQTVQDYQEAREQEATPASLRPNIGLTVFGRFNAF